MNNNSHNNPGLPDTECLTEQQMLDYSSNKLTPRERHSVEKHALDCELCADALEGFAMIQDHSKLDETVFEVNALLTGQLPAKKSGWWDTRMKVAASVAILVLLGSVYYFQGNLKDKTENAFAQNFQPYPAAKEGKLEKGKDKYPASADHPEMAPAMTDDRGLQHGTVIKSGEDVTLKRSLIPQEQGLAEMQVKEEASNESPVAYSWEASDGLTGSAPPPSADEMEKPNTERVRSEESKNYAAMTKDKDSEDDLKQSPAALNNIAITDANNNAGNNTGITNSDSKAPVDPNSKEAIYSTSGAGTPAPQPVYNTGATGNTIVTSTNTSPAGSQGLVAKQDAYFKQPEKKSNDNLITLEKTKKTAYKTRSATDRSKTDTYKPKAKGKEESVAKEQAAGTYQVIMDGEISRESNEKTVSSLDSISTPPPFQTAMQKYDAGRHGEAVVLFEQTLSAEPSNVEALFYSSVSYLALNKPDKALANLDKVLAAKNHSFTDPAKWYKALAYLKKGDKKTAKVLLEQIAKENGSFKQKAANALKDLD